MDRGTWWATVHGVTKSQTQLSAHTHTVKNQRFSIITLYTVENVALDFSSSEVEDHKFKLHPIV